MSFLTTLLEILCHSSFYIGHLRKLIIDLYLMMIDVILLRFTHCLALSNSNSAEKSSTENIEQ